MNIENTVAFPDMSNKPFRTQRRAKFDLPGELLLSDHANALKNYADIFGSRFFQARDDVIAEMEALSTNPAYRSKLGNVNAAKFEVFATMSSNERQLALRLAEEAMNQLIGRVAEIISCEVRDYPDDLWIEFETKAVVYKVLGYSANRPKLKKIAVQKMTGDPQVTLGGSIGRWLNKFEKSKLGSA